MEGCKKYSNTRAEMLRLKYEIRQENEETLMQLKFFMLLKYDRAGMAS